MFRNGIRLILIIYRSNDGTKDNGRHIKTYITNGEKDFNKKMNRAERFIKKSSKPLRIYSSTNKRNLKKAIREFKKRQLDVEYGNDEVLEKFYLSLKSRWISCLAKPSNRDETIFKYDVDIKDEKNKLSLISEIEKYTEILSVNKTKQGWHIFVKPFNHTLIDAEKYVANLQKDSLVLWKW